MQLQSSHGLRMLELGGGENIRRASYHSKTVEQSLEPGLGAGSTSRQHGQGIRLESRLLLAHGLEARPVSSLLSLRKQRDT